MESNSAIFRNKKENAYEQPNDQFKFEAKERKRLEMYFFHCFSIKERPFHTLRGSDEGERPPKLD